MQNSQGVEATMPSPRRSQNWLQDRMQTRWRSLPAGRLQNSHPANSVPQSRSTFLAANFETDEVGKEITTFYLNAKL